MSLNARARHAGQVVVRVHESIRQSVNENWALHPWLGRREPRVGLALTVAVCLGGVWLLSWLAHWLIEATGPGLGRLYALVALSIVWSALEFADARGWIANYDYEADR